MTHATTPEPLLSVRDLTVAFPSEAGRVDAVRGVSFDVQPGKTLAIVGESGSGKSVTSLAVMGLLAESARVEGSIKLAGTELLGLSDGEMSKIRGNDMAMVFQDPLSSLTPVYTIGTQIVEALQVHGSISKAKAWERAVDLLAVVGIPNPKARAHSFPHELSGGMRQRVVIAIAIANNPKLIIADEPTTALDVTIQAQILEVLKTAQRETGAAVVLITHDLGVVAGSADDVLVMYAGKPVERAEVDELFAAPKMPYTIGLLGAVPRVDMTTKVPLTPILGNPPILIDLPPGCPFEPRCPVAVDECRTAEPPLGEISDEHFVACLRSGDIAGAGTIGGAPVYPIPELPESVVAGTPRVERAIAIEVNDLHKDFPLLKGFFKRRVGTVHAVNGLTFDIRKGETLAIVGESGCGKSTTLLEIMNFSAPPGVVSIGGTDPASLGKREARQLRSGVQIVFQDPMGALDPRFTVFDIIGEPLRAFGWNRSSMVSRVRELMNLVGLDPAHTDRFPGAFSGGQRQRIGIARALATNPKLVVLDEPVSALDVSIQAGVINLLDELKAKLGLSYLFVAHDLSVVRHIADRVAVMYLGKFVEVGDTAAIFAQPQHPYTEALLSAIPVPDPKVERTRARIVLAGDLPSPTEKHSGCSFAGRCPLHLTLTPGERDVCLTSVPELQNTADDHTNACHFRRAHDRLETPVTGG